ncbi:MAG: SDR family oxidoreductase [Anaerolineae bacterium]
MGDARKKVIVTGASSGIGRATAQRFAAEGWDVCVLARRADLLETLRESFPPGDHLVCPGSYDSAAVIDQMQQMITYRWGRVDALINCAGVFIGEDALASSLDAWRKPFDLMVNGAVLVTRAAASLMSDGGRIVHVTSIHGERVEMRGSAYAMAKAAINQYSRALALELAPRRILVNAIAPGFINTPMSVVNGVNELESDWFRQNYIEGHHLPLKRAGEPQEIAGVAYFLAGPDASYITGQVLTVDGGLTITF